MSKIFSALFVIFGLVVGSGFASGKEIFVFFARFGAISYLYIFLACVLFFCVFSLFLLKGKKISEVIEKSKVLSLILVLVSVIFCASMFAGLSSLFGYLFVWLRILCFVLVLFLTFLVALSGIGALKKMNLILMPIVSMIFFIVLLFASRISLGGENFVCSFFGVLYFPLYVALNTCGGVFVLAKLGEKFSKKQAVLCSLFSSILILLFLVLGNFVLQKNSSSFLSEMPFLFVVKENNFLFCLSFLVVLVGCFTTLISLCFSIKICFEKVLKNDFLSACFSVWVPFVLSLLGFSKIVSVVYPIASVLGIFVLLFSIFSLDKTDEEIHQKRQNAQD